MIELTRQCLALSKARRAYLIRVLKDSLSQKDKIEDSERFTILLKAATAVCGDGIMSKSKAFLPTLGRKMIAYTMREEGFSLASIGRFLDKDRTTARTLAMKMEDAITYQFKEDMPLWRAFKNLVAEYEKEHYEKEIQG